MNELNRATATPLEKEVANATDGLCNAVMHALDGPFNMSGAVMVIAAKDRCMISSFHCSQVVDEQQAAWKLQLAEFLRMRADELESQAALAERDISGAASN